MKLLIKNVLTADARNWKPTRRSIFIENGVIRSIDPVEQHVDSGYDRVFDGSGWLCLPGFINAHLHPSKILYRDLASHCSLSEILSRIHQTNNLETAEDQFAASLYCLKESMLWGTTTAGIFTSRYDSDIEAATALGMRSSIYYAVNNFWNGQETAPLVEQDHMLLDKLEAYLARKRSGVSLHIATSSELSCSPTFLRKMHELAVSQGVTLSLHVAEGKSQSEQCHRTFGMTSIEHLHALGLLSPRVLLVHGAYVHEHEIELLTHSPVGIIHCPISNSYTGAGRLPLQRLLAGSCRIGMGTDAGMVNPINHVLSDVHFALYAHGSTNPSEVVEAANLLDMATVGNARLLGWDSTGLVEQGATADLLLYEARGFDRDSPNAALAILRYALQNRPHTVIVDGRIVVEKYQMVRVSGEELDVRFAQARKKVLRGSP